MPDPLDPTVPADAPSSENEPGRSRWLWRTLVISSGLLVGLGAAGFAGFRYDAAHAGEFLPGVVIGDVPAAGMRSRVVLDRVDAGLPALRSSAIKVTAGDHDAKVTMAQMGLRSDSTRMVQRARADAVRLGVARRVWHRLLDKPVNRSYPVKLEVDRDAARSALAPLAEQVKVEPVDARIDTSSGFVTILPASAGRTLDLAATAERVYALAERKASGGEATALSQVEAPLIVDQPKVTGFPDVILVRTGENKLYHYENGTLAKTYMVATGSTKYPTPKGVFSIVEKRRNPTWINPDPKGWGKSLPARIAPGPSNPLGTRAMNVSAPGIRIHGTKNNASLGTPASHGCIRMSISDSEALFEIVDKGTPVAIIQGPPPAPKESAPVSTIGDPNSPVDLEAG